MPEAGDSGTAAMTHVMVQAIPNVTTTRPGAGGDVHTEGAFSQALAMARVVRGGGHFALDATLNAEGLVMPRGELTTSASGEGFVDRRHPHAYLHEFMLTAMRSMGAFGASVSAGRGFAPFGTDDPMMRPLEKYPANHHLAQILERVVAIGAVSFRALQLEAGTFGGDEPTSPLSIPRLARFGDSWAVRSTLAPAQGVELQASLAHVASPEEPLGHGLDQRKRSVSLRAISRDGGRYLLAEFARTVDHDHDRRADIFAYESSLVEGSVAWTHVGLAARLEQTDRPEEERTDDPFRTGRPATDLSIAGITRWRTLTVHVEAPRGAGRMLQARPWVEVAGSTATARQALALLTPDRLYGTTKFVMISAGVRIVLGGSHARMGRYGVAEGPSPVIRSMGSPAGHSH